MPITNGNRKFYGYIIALAVITVLNLICIFAGKPLPFGTSAVVGLFGVFAGGNSFEHMADGKTTIKPKE